MLSSFQQLPCYWFAISSTVARQNPSGQTEQTRAFLRGQGLSCPINPPLASSSRPIFTHRQFLKAALQKFRQLLEMLSRVILSSDLRCLLRNPIRRVAESAGMRRYCCYATNVSGQVAKACTHARHNALCCANEHAQSMPASKPKRGVLSKPQVYM